MNKEEVAIESSPETEQIPSQVNSSSTLQEMERAEREIFRDQIQKAGGAVKWLSSRGPRAFALVSSFSSEIPLKDRIESESRIFWVGLEKRLTECETCPPEGTGCVGSNVMFNPGVLVKIKLNKVICFEKSECPKYQDHLMAERLQGWGVDLVRSRSKLAELGMTPEIAQYIGEYFESLKGSKPRKQLLFEGTHACEYAVAILRNTYKMYQNWKYKSVHVPSLIEECKSAMTEKEKSPLESLKDFNLLVLDAVEPTSLKNTYFMPQIRLLYERRRDKGLATIITTPKPCKAEEAFTGVTVLKV
jgi:hypothetical protein